MYHRNPIANDYIPSLYLPVKSFLPLLLNLHAISKAATMTDPTTRTVTTATTTPITVPGPLPEGPSLPFAGGSWDDMRFEEDARWDVATVIGIAAKEVIGESGAATVIDRMELLVTSGTVYGGYRSNKNRNAAQQQEQWACQFSKHNVILGMK